MRVTGREDTGSDKENRTIAEFVLPSQDQLRAVCNQLKTLLSLKEQGNAAIEVCPGIARVCGGYRMFFYLGVAAL